MRKKGSITAFLSLVLVVLFSFLMTMLEGARIRGASAYLSMVSELAADSFLASYYYPLVQQYRLFGVDAGDGNGYFSENYIKENLMANAEYGMSGLKSGVLAFDNTDVSVTQYKCIMEENGSEFLEQIREQIVLDGLSLGITELFREEDFVEAGAAGKIYRRQEDALAETATVTREILSLMQLTDGIRTGKYGLKIGKDGRLQTSGAFIKQILPANKEELRQAFDNEEVYNTVSDSFFRADQAAEAISDMLTEAEELETTIWNLEQSLETQRQQYDVLRTQEDAEETKADLEDAMYRLSLEIRECKERKKTVLVKAENQYKTLKSTLENVETVLEESLTVLRKLEKKQEKAREEVSSYEVFLTGMESMVSAELYEVFEGELETMKIYTGMEKQGYYAPAMRQTIDNNLSILQGFSLEGFSRQEPGRIRLEMEQIAEGMRSYSAERIWFTYGDIVVAEQNGADVVAALAELLTTGILELVGVPKEKQSDGKLTGVDLPSASLEGESFFTDLMSCIAEMENMFAGGEMGDLLKKAGNALLDTTALELYGMKYFRCFLDESEVTKLKYEREYLVFGAKKDKTNLLCMVVYLTAIRTLFSMVSILKQPDKMAAIEAFAAGVAGCTGIPILLSVIKFALILLWSVEEALVEVAAMLIGKRIPVLGKGTISMGDLLAINKSMIAEKARRLPSGAGPGYKEYLILLSLTKTVRKKTYRSMDLIQENIRFRYRDSFRMRNVVTELDFCAASELKRLYASDWFSKENYLLEWKEHCAY